jgi:hypothetical protein
MAGAETPLEAAPMSALPPDGEAGHGASRAMTLEGGTP